MSETAGTSLDDPDGMLLASEARAAGGGDWPEQLPVYDVGIRFEVRGLSGEDVRGKLDDLVADLLTDDDVFSAEFSVTAREML